MENKSKQQNSNSHEISQEGVTFSEVRPEEKPQEAKEEKPRTSEIEEENTQKKNPFPANIRNIAFFVILFFVGVGISYLIRQGKFKLPTFPQKQPEIQEEVKKDEIHEPEKEGVVEEIPDPYKDWLSYPVISGITKEPIEGVSFKLPKELDAPSCDTATCASQGTYLPDGSRFTVAARGEGQILKDPRGSVIIDSSGREFSMNTTFVFGLKATEFSADFTGTTTGEYKFSAMHGVMIEVADDVTIEANIFAPEGEDVTFASDKALFGEILQSFTFPLSGSKGEELR